MTVYELTMGSDNDVRHFTFSLHSTSKSGWCWMKLMTIQDVRNGIYSRTEHTEVDPVASPHDYFSSLWRGRKMSDGVIFLYGAFGGSSRIPLDEFDERTIIPANIQSDTS